VRRRLTIGRLCTIAIDPGRRQPRLETAASP
jgi:hypothetical protein